MGSAARMEDSGHVLKPALNDAPSSTQAEEGDKISSTEEPYPSGNEHECPQDGAEVESSAITKAKASSSVRSFKNIVFELLNGAVISSSICRVKDPMWYEAYNVSQSTFRPPFGGSRVGSPPSLPVYGTASRRPHLVALTSSHSSLFFVLYFCTYILSMYSTRPRKSLW